MESINLFRMIEFIHLEVTAARHINNKCCSDRFGIFKLNKTFQ